MIQDPVTMSNAPREEHIHIVLPPGVGFDPRFMDGARYSTSRIDLAPVVIHDPRLAGDNVRHIYH